jgi:hypothetical protein
MTGSVHTIQTDASVVCADEHVAYTKCAFTILSFLGLLDCLSSCHYGGHPALVLVVVWGLLNGDDDGAAKGPCCKGVRLCSMTGVEVVIYARSKRSIGIFDLYVCAGTASTGYAG